MTTPFITIPTYDNGTWTETIFNTREDFRDYIRSLFRDAGPDVGYNFDVTSEEFNRQARIFHNQGYYCNAPYKSRDFMEYWDDQKRKCRFGVIYKSPKGEWYLPRNYYMWLNFLPIYDKVKKRFDFSDVWDSQYHTALYELLAELNYCHIALLKKRQWGSSYFHMAKLLNMYWFEEGSVNKIGASLKDYISEKGSWKFLNEYRNFLNEHTAWYRPSEPDKIFSWQQRIKVRIANRDTYKGNKSVITGTSFEKDPTNGVGGPVTYFFHEEAGIAPRMMNTYEYMRPALQSGMVTTGVFIAAGSVGDLDQCVPLKEMILKPNKLQIYPVTTNLIDDKGTIGETGLFIPEQWSMPPFIDAYGNSMVVGALEAIKLERLQWKKDLSPEMYQLRISQKPTNIDEAFATRSEPVFPSHLVTHQLKRIDEGEYPVEYVDIEPGLDGKLRIIPTRKLPILDFPVDKNMEDKSGAVCIYERPIEGAPWGTYFASVDPVSEGKTITSDSLCSIILYRNDLEVTTVDDQGVPSTEILPGQIVLTWCGRYDDINKTHERLERIIELYNAWTLVEANVSLFIQHMIRNRKQRFLVPKDQIPFLKEMKSNMTSFQDYGWKNTGNLFKGNLLSYGIEFIKEEISKDTNEKGEEIKSTIRYGVERIPDKMILVEMKEYQHGLNVDRLVAYCALVAFVQVINNNLQIVRKARVDQDKLVNPQKMSKLSMRSPFRHIGNNSPGLSGKGSRNAFKNIR